MKAHEGRPIQAIAPAFLHTPQFADPSLSRALGRDSVVKVTLNPIRSFKGRGEGAGTIAVELAPLGLDAIVVPVGNGALISGIGCWTKARSPRTRIIGCAADAPAMATSWRTGAPETTGPARTMAGGIAVRVPVPAAVAWMREVDIRRALRLVRDTLSLILEPSGAVGIVAALRHDLGAASLATILTGGNFSPGLLRELAPDPARTDHTASPAAASSAASNASANTTTSGATSCS